MFWGLVLEPGKRYTKVVDNSFHISAAVLDTTASDKDIVRVMVEVDEVETLIANLSAKHGILQCPLDLSFEVGSQVAFYTSGGKLPVHLSGYVVIDDELLDDKAEEEEDATSEEDIPNLVDPATLKRKQEASSPVAVKKSKVMEFTHGKPHPGTVNGKGKADVKKKLLNLSNEVDVDDEEDEDMDADEEEEDDSDDDDDDDDEEEEDDEDEDEEDDDEEEDEEDEDVEKATTMKTGKVQQHSTPAGAPKIIKTKAATTTPLPEKMMKIQHQTPKSEKKSLSKQNTPLEKTKLKTPKSEGKSVSQVPKTPEKNKSTTPKNEQKMKPTTPKNEQMSPKGQESVKQGKKTPKQEKTVNGKTPQKDTPQRIADKSSQGTPQGTPKPTKIVKQGGVTCEDLVVGTGPDARRGKMVFVYYEGRLMSNNKMFDKCNSGRGFKFRLGQGEVIPGWDVGVAGMKIGGKRRIVCPPNMAYGKKGAPPDIPPHSTLMFIVELKSIS